MVSGWWHIVRTSDTRSRGPGFDSRPLHFHATTLDKLLTHVHASVTKQCTGNSELADQAVIQ